MYFVLALVVRLYRSVFMNIYHNCARTWLYYSVYMCVCVCVCVCMCVCVCVCVRDYSIMRLPCTSTRVNVLDVYKNCPLYDPYEDAITRLLT